MYRGHFERIWKNNRTSRRVEGENSEEGIYSSNSERRLKIQNEPVTQGIV
jgi:hypothetical protein